MSRLEEIKKLWNENNDPCNPDDYEWLIQQAERVPMLETSIKRLRNRVEKLEKNNAEEFKKVNYLHERYNKSKKQNQRYKQSLEELKFQIEYVSGDVEYLLGFIDEALKEGESE